MRNDVLNLSTHCLQQWREELAGAPGALHRRVLSGIARDLERAVKFVLPEGGRLMDDDRSVARVFHDLRLPFPVVALEYRSTGVVAAHETPSSKRISLIWDARQAEPALLEGTAASRGVLPGAPGLYVQSISYMDDYEAWMPVMATAYVDLAREPVIPEPGDVSELELELVRHRLRPGFERSPAFPVQFIAHDDFFLDHLGGEAAADAIFRADSGDELSAALAFAALTTCANVAMETVRAPAPLNRKREASGKTPFFDTRILQVADGGYVRRGTADAGGAGSHASPRAHLRRGHIRSLGERNVWVNAAAVNAWKATPAQPGYQLQAVRDENDEAGDLPRPRG
ncbi:MAG: hypothetical protein K0Q43_89 [Ramlibacter sp.]|jgi:hypothetical protein|nr:hypothetical protein [Ramlibacter sp.]